MKKKGLLTLVGSVCLTLALVVLLLPACAKEEAPAPAGLPKITWRATTMCGSTAPVDFGGTMIPGRGGLAEELCKRVTERTNGNFTINFYIAGALVKPMEVQKALSSGVIEAAFGTIGNMYTGVIPEATFATNFIMGPSSCEDFWKVITETEFMAIMRHAYAKHNIYFLGKPAGCGDGIIGNFPIRSLADFKGKKIKTGGISAKILEAYGAIPVVISMPEIYTALQRGTCDGTMLSYDCGITYKLFEVVSYCQLPPLCSTGVENLVNLDAWNSLPQEYKDILQEESDKEVERTYKEFCPLQDRLSQEISEKEYDVTWTTIPPAEWEKMKELAMPQWDEYAKKTEDCAKLMKIFKEAVGAK